MMAGLKTLDDTAAATAAAAAAAAAVQDAAVNEAQEALEAAAEGADAAELADAEAALAALTAERDAAIERGDSLETDYLAQSDKLAAANAALAKAAGDLKEALETIDQVTGAKAQVEAQLAALGVAPPKPVRAVKIKRPEPGKALELPDESARAKGEDVAAALLDGEVLVLVLLDDAGRVQPYPAQVGGAELFTLHSPEIDPYVLFCAAIELRADMAHIEVRQAVLLDAKGTVLSSCRFGALLIGGGGNTALIPGNGLAFRFAR